MIRRLAAVLLFACAGGVAGAAATRLHAIAHTTRPPLGVSIEGRRVVWAENFPAGRGDARGRLMTLSLP